MNERQGQSADMTRCKHSMLVHYGDCHFCLLESRIEKSEAVIGELTAIVRRLESPPAPKAEVGELIKLIKSKVKPSVIINEYSLAELAQQIREIVKKKAHSIGCMAYDRFIDEL